MLASNPLPVINEQIYTSRELLVATLARDIAVVTQEARLESSVLVCKIRGFASCLEVGSLNGHVQLVPNVVIS